MTEGGAKLITLVVGGVRSGKSRFAQALAAATKKVAFPSGRQFRDFLGEINQKIARVSDNVVLMIAGCPFAIKGVAEVQR